MQHAGLPGWILRTLTAVSAACSSLARLACVSSMALSASTCFLMLAAASCMLRAAASASLACSTCNMKCQHPAYHGYILKHSHLR